MSAQDLGSTLKDLNFNELDFELDAGLLDGIKEDLYGKERNLDDLNNLDLEDDIPIDPTIKDVDAPGNTSAEVPTADTSAINEALISQRAPHACASQSATPRCRASRSFASQPRSSRSRSPTRSPSSSRARACVRVRSPLPRSRSLSPSSPRSYRASSTDSSDPIVPGVTWAIPPPPEESFPSYEACTDAVHAWTKQHGFDLVLEGKSKKVKKGPHKGEIYWRRMECVFGGKPRNSRKLTEETRIRKMRGSCKWGCKADIIIAADDPQYPNRS